MSSVRQLLGTAGFISAHPLNENRKLRALARWVAWQVSHRRGRTTREIPFVNGSRFCVTAHSPATTAALYVGLPDFEEMAFLLHLLRKEDLFVDLGANAGVWTVLAGAGIGARCIAVEPIPETFRKLEQQIALNGMGDRVQAVQAGVGAEDGALRFTSGLDAANKVIVAGDPASRDSILVEVTTLDRLCEASTPRLVKIDVEGWELEVIRGAARTLDNPQLIALVIETFRPHNYKMEKLRTLESILASAGFTPFRYEPRARRLVPLAKENEGSNNTIYVRERAIVEQLLQAALPFTIHGHSI